MLVFGAVYFFFIRPRQQRMRQQQTQARQLSVGDEVVSAGGIHGRVVAIDNDVAEVEVAPGVVMTFLRRSISARPERPAAGPRPRPAAIRAAPAPPASAGTAPAPRRPTSRGRPSRIQRPPRETTRARATRPTSDPDMRRGLVWCLVAVVGIVVVAFGATLASGHTPLLGLDLKGGVSVVLQPQGTANSAELDEAVSIIERRVNGLGVANSNVARQGGDVVINLPGIKDAQGALKILGETATLYFRPVNCLIPAYAAAPTTTPTTAPSVDHHRATTDHDRQGAGIAGVEHPADLGPPGRQPGRRRPPSPPRPPPSCPPSRAHPSRSAPTSSPPPTTAARPTPPSCRPPPSPGTPPTPPSSCRTTTTASATSSAPPT